MGFNVVHFAKGNMFRSVWICDEYYRIQGMNNICGKRHFGSPIEYISKMLADGWVKVNEIDYLKIKYKRKENFI